MIYKTSYIQFQDDLDKYIKDHQFTILKDVKFLFNYSNYHSQYDKLKNLVDLEFVISIWENLYEGKIIKVHVEFGFCKSLNLPNGIKTRAYISYIINLPKNKSYCIYFWIVQLENRGKILYSNTYYQYRKFASVFFDMDPQSIYDWNRYSNAEESVVTMDVPELGFMKAEKINSLCYRCKYFNKIHSAIQCAVHPINDCTLTFDCKDYEIIL